jgi:uncharacterized phage protein gp47/JayE
MAYENMTYEVILNRMMDRVFEKYPNLDNREGSIVYNAIAPAALELTIMYTELDNVLRESFVATASREYLLIACEDMGIDVSTFEANAGVHKGKFDIEVPIGSQWNCELFNYTVTEFIGMEDEYYTYKLSCDTLGTSPNNLTGDLTPITDITIPFNYAKIVECLIEGENETSDEGIRDTYYTHVNSVATDGNIGQYELWCREYDGIGNYKIFPLWNGANTVKVSILSASNKSASETLIQEFQEYLDPGIKGMGDGVAPIGAFVTVATATEDKINLSANIKMKQGYSDTAPVNEALTKYFSDIAYEKSTVAYMNVGSAIIGVDGVESITDLKINGGIADITLQDEHIPVLGTTNWVVI